MSSSNLTNNTPQDFERFKFIIGTLREEVMYRREQQWKVFNWVTTLLLGIIAGIIALAGKGFYFHLLHQFVAGFAVFILALFASLRINHDASVAKAHSTEAFNLAQTFNVAFDDKQYKKRHLGHIGFIYMLAGAALILIIFASAFNLSQPTSPTTTSSNANITPK